MVKLDCDLRRWFHDITVILWFYSPVIRWYHSPVEQKPKLGRLKVQFIYVYAVCCGKGGWGQIQPLILVPFSCKSKYLIWWNFNHNIASKFVWLNSIARACFIFLLCTLMTSANISLEKKIFHRVENVIKQLVHTSAVRSSRYEARGKFGEHERCVRVARGVAESNSSFLSAL